MFSIKYRKEFDKSPTVEELIIALKDYPSTAKVTVLGDPQFYIHGESDGSTIVFDDSPMDEEYETITADLVTGYIGQVLAECEMDEEATKLLSRLYEMAVNELHHKSDDKLNN